MLTNGDPIISGITRGGNVPATIILNMTGIRCEALKGKFT